MNRNACQRWTWMLAAVLSSQAAASAAEPAFELRPSKPADALAVSKDGTTFTVQSKSGIGGAVIERTAGQWPEKVVFCFQYSDGSPFKGLEGFKLHAERFRIEGSQKESGKMTLLVPNADGNFEPKGRADVQVKQGKEALEVSLSANLLKDAKKIEIHWIDFYR